MIQTVNGKYPVKHKTAYVHPNAVVIGDVKLGKDSSVWPGAVVRGDIAEITIGGGSNIQDCCQLHTDTLKLAIGRGVTVGHGATLHSCDIGDGSLVGMGAIILDAAKIGENCIIGAGTVIPGGKEIPAGSVVIGNPYRIVRQATPEDINGSKKNCEEYIELARLYIRTGDIL
jgi:carbonic anhydrase/acetyltransferase-like protein (isoleucine patch superfamily)